MNAKCYVSLFAEVDLMRLLDLGYLASVLTPSIRESLTMTDDDQSASQSMVWKGSKVESRKSKRDSCVISYFILSLRACCPSLINLIKVCAEPISPGLNRTNPSKTELDMIFLVFHRLRVKPGFISVVAESFISGDSSFKVAVGDL